MKKILFILLLFASCEKADICQPVLNLKENNNLVQWDGNAESYTIERYDKVGVLMEVITTDKRQVQIERLTLGYVRVKPSCGQWSEFIYLHG